jgi:predicted transcriptional regulator
MATSTTTLRLDARMKARIAKLAKKSGKSPHSFVLDMLEGALSAQESREEFEKEAAARLKQIDATGLALDWDETKAWLRARAAGKPAKKLLRAR